MATARPLTRRSLAPTTHLPKWENIFLCVSPTQRCASGFLLYLLHLLYLLCLLCLHFLNRQTRHFCTFKGS
jgi:hypothetical protein